MKLAFFTIVLDGGDLIKRHLPTFQQLTTPWRWLVAEGVAMPNQCTSWVKGIEPRLSLDGTTEYLRSIQDERVTVEQRPQWHSKVEMVNWCVRQIKEPCILIQIDADEIWTAEQLEMIATIFRERPTVARMRFRCRYFVGPNLVLRMGVEDRNHWLRAWRFGPHCYFTRHEPPTLKGMGGEQMEASETARLGLVFDHLAYVTPEQALFREEYYGYRNALDAWERLQRHDRFPVALQRFFPWADPNSIVERLP